MPAGDRRRPVTRWRPRSFTTARGAQATGRGEADEEQQLEAARLRGARRRDEVALRRALVGGGDAEGCGHLPGGTGRG